MFTGCVQGREPYISDWISCSFFSFFLFLGGYIGLHMKFDNVCLLYIIDTHYQISFRLGMIVDHYKCE